MYFYYTACLAIGIVIGYTYGIYEHQMNEQNKTIDFDFHDLE